MSRPLESLAQRVKHARLARALTQEALAKAAEVAQSDVSKIERGLILSTTAIGRLARALRVPVLWLELGEGPEPDWSNPDLVEQPEHWLESWDRDYQARRRGVAHDLSHAAPTVEFTTIDWGDLMNELPRAFTLVARDDAMAPLLAKGHKARFSTERVAERTDLPGRKVLVADRDGNAYIREYRQRRAGQWTAVAINDAAGLDPLDSIADGLTVLAVMTGVDWE